MKTRTYLIVLFGFLLSGCDKKESSAKMKALPVEVAKLSIGKEDFGFPLFETLQQ